MNITTLNTKVSHQSIINPIVEENSLTDIGLRMLSQIKPVLRKQVIHNSKNVFLNFKSIEIQLVEERIREGKQQFKFLTPIYVPLSKVEGLMQLDKVELEMHLLRSIHSLKNVVHSSQTKETV
mmetsp:Transcript_5149/g.7913  ORF Transcript_5149/g.7913 Transcript_5149/m.7913 type:complete len:123 (+) Transcript_5149:2165-2533(+)